MYHASKSGRRRGSTLALSIMVALVAAACNPVFGETSGPVQHATLTSTNGYEFAYTGDAVSVTAWTEGTFPEVNVRELFWKTESPFYPDQQSCITWDTLADSQPGGLLQPGLAMRIAPTGPDGQDVKAITVNQNIWYAGMWLIWVNSWDTTRPGNPYVGVESFDLSPIVGRFYSEDGVFWSTLVDGPWRVCARTQGDQLSFKLWPVVDAEPGWDDPDHVFSTTLPEGFDYAGYSGGYIGHLREGQHATFSDFSTMPLCLAPDMLGTPACPLPTEGDAPAN